MPSLSDLQSDDMGGVLLVNGISAGSALNAATPSLKMVSGGVIRSITGVIKGSAGIATGAVAIEGSLDPVTTPAANVGNWFALGAPVTAVASVATPMFSVAGPVYWVRARISTAIGGGTVSVDLLLSGD